MSLIEHGADVNAAGDNALALAAFNHENSTPLHSAVSSRNTATVKFLLTRGADTSIEDSDGRTALANAKKMKQAELIALLEKGAEAAPEKPKPAKKTAKPDKAGKAAK